MQSGGKVPPGAGIVRRAGRFAPPTSGAIAQVERVVTAGDEIVAPPTSVTLPAAAIGAHPARIVPAGLAAPRLGCRAAGPGGFIVATAVNSFWPTAAVAAARTPRRKDRLVRAAAGACIERLAGAVAQRWGRVVLTNARRVREDNRLATTASRIVRLAEGTASPAPGSARRRSHDDCYAARREDRVALLAQSAAETGRRAARWVCRRAQRCA